MAEKQGAQGAQRTPGEAQEGLDVSFLLSIVNNATVDAKNKLTQMQESGPSSISIADMFGMQMIMNKLSQTTEMAGSIVSATNTSINSLARSIKG